MTVFWVWLIGALVTANLLYHRDDDPSDEFARTLVSVGGGVIWPGLAAIGVFLLAAYLVVLPARLLRKRR